MDMMEKYRAVFLSSDIGKEVLGDILTVCEFGCTLVPSDQGRIGKHNVGVMILGKCGVFGKGTLPQVLNAFAAVMPEKEEKDETIL